MDRINEAYYGKMGAAMQEASSKRIEWILSQVQGERILDIGCSQGVVPILLGREGKYVVGIDIDAASIAYAADELSKESEEVQERVSFACCDLFWLKKEQEYDCVLITEVLEHVQDPDAFLFAAASFLKEGGTIVVSVPFGTNPAPDHKRTYFVTDIYDQLSKHFTVKKMKTLGEESKGWLGSWIGFVAVKEANASKAGLLLDEAVLRQTEAAFRRWETVLFQKQVHAGKVAEAKNKENALLRRENEDISQQIDKQNKEYADLEKRHNGLLDQHNALSEKHIVLLDQHNSLLDQHNALSEGHSAMLEEYRIMNERQIVVEEERDSLRNHVSEVEKKCADETRKNTILAKENSSLKKACSAAENKYMILSKSVLGGLQLSYWRMRTKQRKRAAERKLERAKKKNRRKNRSSLKQRIINFAKSFPWIVRLVRKLRAYQTKKAGKVQQPAQNAIVSAQQTNAVPIAVEKSIWEGDESYFPALEPMLEEIADSNGTRYYEKIALKIGIIADEFFFQSVKDAADFVYIPPCGWEEKLDGLDCMLLVSAWHGLQNKEWAGLAKTDSTAQNIAKQIVNACDEKNIPTIFYSKEDPPHYNDFLWLAKICKYVFTTAEEKIPDYKHDCGHERVAVLPFGINPMYHNPIGFRHYEKKKEVIFSGSWYEKYPERNESMRMMFDGALASGCGLRIIDRNLHLRQEKYHFPNMYMPYVAPAIHHKSLQKVHKLYNWAFNINTVTTSTTMFANRAYELQAAGNLLISNYSVGMNSELPFVFIATDQEEVQNILNGYTDEQIYERQIAGIRDVMAGKTCFDRIGSMLAAIGSDVKPPKRAVAVLAETITSELKEMFESQTYPDKELFSIADVTEEDIAEYAMVAFFDAAAYYGPFYLEDMVNGFKYTASDYITKAAYHGNDGFISGPEHEYVSIMPDKTHTLFWRSCFTLEQLLSMGKEASLPNGYSIDRFQHSYAPAIKKERRDYRLTVSLPVYNNGRHLCGKAFSSLMRSSMFEDMDIILVDDGSTDGYTPKVVKSLVDRYPNVRSYFFNDGGSGSASRPRNKGDEMAFAPYVTYLDPDNEAIHDGYAKLYKITTEGDYDLVISDMLICNDICVSTAYSKEIMRYSEDGIVSGDKKKFLAGIKFTPMSVQGMIVQKDLIKKNNITSVVGAVGEDSFMSWQLMYYANKICAVKLDTHIYYALVSGSTVNTISKKYFEKLLIMEKARYPWLEQTGLLSSHMKVRFNYYFRYWTLKKLSQTKEHDKEESAKLCYAMYSIYDGDYNGEDALINRFAAMCKEEDYIGAQAYVESVMKKAN